MAVSKQKKSQILADLTAKMKDAQSIGFAATSALSVKEFEDMRNSLRGVEASYMIAKKTLIVKAAKDALGIDIDISHLPGQIGVVCSNGDAIAGLGKVNDVVKKTKGEKISWAASIFEGEFKDMEATKAIAGMPSRETLLGRLVGSMKSPISGLARFFDAAGKELESQGKSTVGELEGKKSETPAQEVEAKEEAPKAEEVATQEPASEEVKEEEKAAE